MSPAVTTNPLPKAVGLLKSFPDSRERPDLMATCSLSLMEPIRLAIEWADRTGTTHRWASRLPHWVCRACDHLMNGSLCNPDSQSRPLCPGEVACQGMSLLTLSCRHDQRKLFISVKI